MSSTINPGLDFARDADATVLAVIFKPLQALLAAPSFLYLATLAIMLFRPPNLEFYFLDRIAFALLVLIVLLRATLLRQSLRLPSKAIWPMAGLLALVVADLLSHPFDSTLWSVAAAKFVVAIWDVLPGRPGLRR